MKKGIFLCLVLGLLILSAATAGAADWVLYVETGDGGKEYFDKSSIVRLSADSVKVMTKLILSPQQKQVVVDAGVKDGLPAYELERTHYLQSYYAINCTRKQFQVLSIAHYDTNGKQIRSDERPEAIKYEWDKIPENTVADHLQKAVCPLKGKAK
jgi:hypothetical protein